MKMYFSDEMMESYCLPQENVELLSQETTNLIHACWNNIKK